MFVVLGCNECGKISTYSSPNFGGYGIFSPKVVNRAIHNETFIYLYLFKIFNDQETFYKIGLSNNPLKRSYGIRSATKQSYSVEILYKEYGLLKDMFVKEQTLLTSSTVYVPLIYFGGYTECITSIPANLLPNII